MLLQNMPRNDLPRKSIQPIQTRLHVMHEDYPILKRDNRIRRHLRPEEFRSQQRRQPPRFDRVTQIAPQHRDRSSPVDPPRPVAILLFLPRLERRERLQRLSALRPVAATPALPLQTLVLQSLRVSAALSPETDAQASSAPLSAPLAVAAALETQRSPQFPPAPLPPRFPQSLLSCRTAGRLKVVYVFVIDFNPVFFDCRVWPNRKRNSLRPLLRSR